MRLSTHNVLPIEYALDDDRWPKARSYFVEAGGPYTTVALVMPLGICDSSGVAHVLEHLLFRGSARFPNRNLLLETRRNLACLDINAATHEDHLVLHVSSANADELIQVFDAYFGAIQQPTLEQKHFEQEREIVFNEIKATPENLTPDGCINVGGEPQLMKQLTHQSLQSFWQHQCHPEEFIVIVVGEGPMGLSYPLPDRPTIKAPAYTPLKSAHYASSGTLLSLGKIQCAGRQQDAAVVQYIAESLGWRHIQSLAEFTLWHTNQIAIDALRSQITRAEEMPQFDRLLQRIAQQTLYPGSAKHHYTVQIANTLAAAVVRGANLQSTFAQRADSIKFLAHWRDQAWRKNFARELGANNSPEISFRFKAPPKPAPAAGKKSNKGSEVEMPSPVGSWLTINGVSVWVHEDHAVHWALRYENLQASKLTGLIHSPTENLDLACFNQAGNVVAQRTTSGEFSSSDAFLDALQDALKPVENSLTLKLLSPAFVTALNKGKPFQTTGQLFNCPQRPRLHHLSIPTYFLNAIRESGIVNVNKDVVPQFDKVYKVEHQDTNHSGSAVILIPVQPTADAQQEASLHMFAAHLELEHIMPNLREACGAYGGSARYLPHLNAIVLQSYGDPQPKQSRDLLQRWFDQCLSSPRVEKNITAAKHQACSLLQLRGKPSLWYQFGEVITALRWQQTQAVWAAIMKAEVIDASNLICIESLS